MRSQAACSKSDSCPEKLESQFEKSADLISSFPKIGIPTNYRKVYTKTVRDYKIFYRIDTTEIQILTVWDSRPHPDSAEL